MTDNETQIRNIAQKVFDENQTSDQFAVSQTPFHTHNGADSPRISFGNLINKMEFLNINLFGISGQASNNWGIVFTAPFQCTVIGATEVHQTAEATATTMTVQLEKLTGTTASGSGASLLITPFNLKAAANTLQLGILNTTTAKTSSGVFTLQSGDRLGLVLSTTGSSAANLVGVNIIIQLQF